MSTLCSSRIADMSRAFFWVLLLPVLSLFALGDTEISKDDADSVKPISADQIPRQAALLAEKFVLVTFNYRAREIVRSVGNFRSTVGTLHSADIGLTDGIAVEIPQEGLIWFRHVLVDSTSNKIYKAYGRVHKRLGKCSIELLGTQLHTDSYGLPSVNW